MIIDHTQSNFRPFSRYLRLDIPTYLQICLLPPIRAQSLPTLRIPVPISTPARLPANTPGKLNIRLCIPNNNNALTPSQAKVPHALFPVASVIEHS